MQMPREREREEEDMTAQRVLLEQKEKEISHLFFSLFSNDQREDLSKLFLKTKSPCQLNAKDSHYRRQIGLLIVLRPVIHPLMTDEQINGVRRESDK